MREWAIQKFKTDRAKNLRVGDDNFERRKLVSCLPDEEKKIMTELNKIFET